MSDRQIREELAKDPAMADYTRTQLKNIASNARRMFLDKISLAVGQLNRDLVKGDVEGPRKSVEVEFVERGNRAAQQKIREGERPWYQKPAGTEDL